MIGPSTFSPSAIDPPNRNPVEQIKPCFAATSASLVSQQVDAVSPMPATLAKNSGSGILA